MLYYTIIYYSIVYYSCHLRSFLTARRKDIVLSYRSPQGSQS